MAKHTTNALVDIDAAGQFDIVGDHEGDVRRQLLGMPDIELWCRQRQHVVAHVNPLRTVHQLLHDR